MCAAQREIASGVVTCLYYAREMSDFPQNRSMAAFDRYLTDKKCSGETGAARRMIDEEDVVGLEEWCAANANAINVRSGWPPYSMSPPDGDVPGAATTASSRRPRSSPPAPSRRRRATRTTTTGRPDTTRTPATPPTSPRRRSSGNRSSRKSGRRDGRIISRRLRLGSRLGN